MPIKVRVGQTDAIKILSSAGGGSISAQTAINVIGGIASVSQLSVTGFSTLTNVDAGIITATSFVGPLTGTVQTAAQPFITSLGTLGSLNVAGLSTFVGIVTTSGDLFVGGDLFIKDDIVLDNVTGNSLNITGIATVNSLQVNTNAVIAGNLSIGGTLTSEDVTNVDSIGIITARSGIRINTGGLIVSAGIATFGAIATFANNVFVDGTLTAGLIDGGAF